jgi:lipase chaperone LimK
MNEKKIKKANLLTVSILAVSSVMTLAYFLGKPIESTNAVTAEAMVDHTAVESSSAELTNSLDDQITTKQILGFESKHGALPDSLRGTTNHNALQVDELGHLLISSEIKDLFDFFLSTVAEENLDTILLRVDEYLNHYLQEPALSESKAILAQYIEFKSSLVALQQEMGEELAQMSKRDKREGGYLDFLRNQMDQRNSLRAQHLEPEVYQAFYAEEEQYDEYTYSRLMIRSDQSISADDRVNRMNALQSTLPEDVREGMRETQITDELKMKTEQVLASGGGQQEVRDMRRNMLGEEAAKRFDELDKQRAEWKARINDFLAQRARIMSNQGLANEESSAQVDALRESLFDEREQIRVRNAERHVDV